MDDGPRITHVNGVRVDGKEDPKDRPLLHEMLTQVGMEDPSHAASIAACFVADALYRIAEQIARSGKR